MVVTPTKLTLKDPFHRGQSNGDGGRLPLNTKTCTPAISSQSKPRNEHLSISVAPTWGEAPAQPVRRMGVASLLFHRTLSPKDTLQVHSYTLEKKREPSTQLHVHSYAREHQPRHVQNKVCTHSQGHSSSQETWSETTEPEPPVNLTDKIQREKEVQSPVMQNKDENKPKALMSVEGQMEAKAPEVELTSKSPSQTQTLISKHTMEAPKTNKRKVCAPAVSTFNKDPAKVQTGMRLCVC